MKKENWVTDGHRKDLKTKKGRTHQGKQARTTKVKEGHWGSSEKRMEQGGSPWNEGKKRLKQMLVNSRGAKGHIRQRH